ncbi:hypothetical protein D3C87_2032330 [compost metagenome]
MEPSVDGEFRACPATGDNTNATPKTHKNPALRARVATAFSINEPFRNYGLTRNFEPLVSLNGPQKASVCTKIGQTLKGKTSSLS